MIKSKTNQKPDQSHRAPATPATSQHQHYRTSAPAPQPGGRGPRVPQQNMAWNKEPVPAPKWSSAGAAPAMSYRVQDYNFSLGPFAEEPPIQVEEQDLMISPLEPEAERRFTIQGESRKQYQYKYILMYHGGTDYGGA